MANAKPQSYANHARLDPTFHFVLAPLAILSVVLSIIVFTRHPGLPSTLWIVLAIASLVNATKTRTYALTVQDRVIRLEERLRLSQLLPETEKPRSEERRV